ncbi:hypothetical protein [Jatrophihabitans endophyticus]|uniref:arsenate reductase/protein-tyrosine-phosphatase family protein n=1 Tax=Jatrophihabitans endophyticus TaxID=1206085 RepID=UPI0019E4AFC9|nr:hypothetical protein [Jatrophihabitans endophyticus]MBE7189341.1 protein-tyrosine-phosphatase [Jatrophihabitans endophyticus]
MPFSVLFVCTGNICRSPMGERLFAARTHGYDRAEIIATSAGTNGLTGYPMDLPSASVLREFGGDPEGHSARRVETADLDADLVLTATRDHRSALLRIAPLAFRRTFTMREFGRLGSGLAEPADPPDEDGLRARVREVAAQRGFAVPPDDPALDDIGDPYGGSMELTRLAGRQVDDAVDAAIRALGLPAPG